MPEPLRPPPSDSASPADAPDWRPELRRRLAPFALSAVREAEIVDELAHHLDERYAELLARGFAAAAAREQTAGELRRMNLSAEGFGDLRQAKSPAHLHAASHGASLLGGTWHDTRYAVRSLARRPGLTLVAVLTLALGVGLNTSMFSFTNTLLLRPLPFPDADRMERLYRATPENRYGDFTPREYLALEREQDVYGRVAAFRLSDVTLDDPSGAARWLRASAGLFDVLGVRPHIGRPFTEDDERAGRHVAVVGDRFWRDRLGGSRNVLGRLIRIDGDAYEVIGVLPAAANDHRLFGRVGLFTPLGLRAEGGASPSMASVGVVGRRSTHLAPPAGESAVAAVGARAVRAGGGDSSRVIWRSEPLPLSITGPTGRLVAAMLLGLSTCVLLIACSNLATVLLSGAIERRRECVVRAAIGASRLQLARPLLLECALLAAGGGIAGLIAASWGATWLRNSLADAVGFEFPTDWRVITFALAAAALTLVSTGLAPSLFAIRLDASSALKSGGRGATSGIRQRRLRGALVAVQFALATMLLASAGLFLRGTAGLLAKDHGWRSDSVLHAQVQLPTDTYNDRVKIAAFYRDAIDRLERIPGVQAASVSYGLPYLGMRGRTLVQPDGDSGNVPRSVLLNGVSPHYFRVTGTALTAGRLFGDSDGPAAPAVVIVSASLARALFRDGRAVGRRLAFASSPASVWMDIVGVVADTRPVDIAEPPNAFQLYQPVAQDPRPSATVALRTTSVNPESSARHLRAAIEQLDPNVVVRPPSSAQALVDSIGSQVTLVRRLLAAFAALGSFLALLGIYSVMTRTVAQRTMEIGVRLAMGAQVRAVIGLLMTSSIRVAAMGMIAGLAGAAFAARGLAAVFPGMHVDAVVVISGAVALLAATAAGVCFLAARRVSTIDPVAALRAE